MPAFLRSLGFRLFSHNSEERETVRRVSSTDEEGACETSRLKNTITFSINGARTNVNECFLRGAGKRHLE